MHLIEPFDKWVDLYRADEDVLSPFFGREYSESECRNTIYNYFIHPQWDEFGSSTLYLKILYTDYIQSYTIIELMGEWNDCLYNDIMFLKREVIDMLVEQGVKYFIIIGENVLNFHYSDDSYYEEWFDDIDDGWIVFMNFRDHIYPEMKRARIDSYVMYGPSFQHVNWRKLQPQQLFQLIQTGLSRLL